MVVQSVRQLESLATFTLGVGAAVLVPSVWARRHAAIEWLQGLAEQLTCRLYPSQWTESEGESGLLHGRNKHDMTPAQLARRQMEDDHVQMLSLPDVRAAMSVTIEPAILSLAKVVTPKLRERCAL